MKKEIATATQLLFDRRDYYINITRKIRWLVIFLVVFTLPASILFHPVMSGLVVLAFIYNLLWYSRSFKNQQWFSSFISMNIVDNTFVLLLVLFTGGLESPYYVLFTFMAVTATYWFGYRGLAVLGLFHVLVGASLHMFVQTFSPDILRSGIVLIFTFMINGVLAQRLTHSDRQERVMAETAIHEKEAERQWLMSLINSIGDAVIAVRGDGKVLMHNGAALELLDTNMRLVNVPIGKLMKVRNEKGEPVDLMGLLSNSHGIERRRDLNFLASDDSEIDLDITISPITASGGSEDLRGGYIFIIRDITKEKSLDETRNEFISVTSHELRTPIAIAEASLSTALLPKFAPKNEETREMVKKAHENVEFLGSLVRDLSTLAKAEHKILKVDLSLLDPKQLVDELTSDYESEAERRGLLLKKDVSTAVKPIMSSESHVKEILQNFITNSLKYTEKGAITIGVKPDEKTRAAVFFVADTGIGISASDKKQVFGKFYRSEDYRTRKTGGTGLGLYVTKKLAERLGGEIWFDSKLNKGSVFYLKVPPVTGHEWDEKQTVDTQVDDFISAI